MIAQPLQPVRHPIRRPSGVRAEPIGGRVSIRFTPIVIALVAGALVATGPEGAAQAVPEELTLEEAIGIASSNNPAFLSVRNDVGAADWRVREAFASFLPQFSTSAGASYVGAGTQNFGTFTASAVGVGTTDYYLSDYALNLNLQLSGRTFFQASRARADRRAVDAGVQAAAFTLATDVTRQYLLALRAQEGVRVAGRQLQRAEENFELASARVRVGQAAATEGKQAEVERGRAEVALLQAENLLAAERLRLMEQLGVALAADVELASAFDLFDLERTEEGLVDVALDAHPQLRSLRASRDATVAGLRESRSDYLPTVSLSASWSGFTRQVGDDQFLIGQVRSSVQGQREDCQFLNSIATGLSNPIPGYPRDCSQLVLTPADEQSIISGNRAFPFDYEREPIRASLRVSLPIFTGFSRQRQAEEASAAEADARYALRAEELRLRAEIATRFGDVQTTRRIAQIEERNREVAGEQLALARERYRLGAAAFLELLEAESSMAEAERDYLAAVYNFHDALSALESAVGTRLRPES